MRAFLSVILSICLIFGSVPVAYADDGLLAPEIVQDYIEQGEEGSSSSDDGMTDSEDDDEDVLSVESPGVSTSAVPVALIISSIIGGIFTASQLVSAIDNIFQTVSSWLGNSSTTEAFQYAFVAYLDMITQALWDDGLTTSLYDLIDGLIVRIASINNYSASIYSRLGSILNSVDYLYLQQENFEINYFVFLPSIYQQLYQIYSSVSSIESYSRTLMSFLGDIDFFLEDYLDAILWELENLDISGSAATNVWDFLQSLVETLGDVITSLVDIIFGGILELLSSIIGDFNISEISADLSNLSLTVSNSFPFGAIYVITDALAAFSADAKAPYIEWELFDEEIEIDLSMFDDLATGCRYLLLVLYLIGLFKSTKDWAFGGGD